MVPLPTEPVVLAARSMEFLARLRRTLSDAQAVAVPAVTARPAAVLIPLVARDGELRVIYTRRSERLASHRGQVAFPGGRYDRRDGHLLAAALRETEEEIGIAAEAVEVLGSFEGRATRATNIFVTPFVGIVRGDAAMRADPKEVAEIFEVPLSALQAPRYRGHFAWQNGCTTTPQPAIQYAGQTIWGLTYHFTLRLLELGADGLGAPARSASISK
jgi:8-oxo-dGTP pyrophosphatase MutT (NUDIX family)